MTETLTTNTDREAARYLELQDQINSLNEELDGIKARLRDHLGVGNHPGPGGLKISITANNRFSDEQARSVLPPEVYESLTEKAFSTKKARDILAPALYRSLMLPAGEPRVSIR